MQKKNLKFIRGVDFYLIENLPNNGTKYYICLYLMILVKKFQTPNNL